MSKKRSFVFPVAFMLLSLVIAPSSYGQILLPDFTEMVEKNSPAVVNISTSQKAVEMVGQLPKGLEIPEGSQLDELFRRFLDKKKRETPQREAKSLGSGFIISKDGYVVTNHHVIQNANEIVVRLQDRRELVAELIGSDEKSDTALLKIKADNLPVVKLGSVDKLKVGEWVLAIGSPFGFDHSVTAGIVSAKGRSLPSENYVPFIQTDVAINPGNSGGPLFNMKGEVVGINSQIYSRTGGFMGLSFAIPIDVALGVIDQLKKTGHVTRGWLGVMIQDVTRELAESFGMERPYGALVSQIMPDSPSAKGAVQVGDVIIEFNGKEVESSSALPPLVGISPVNENASVKVIRNGKIIELTIKIGELPEQVSLSDNSIAKKPLKTSKIGLSVIDLTSDERKKLKLEEEGVRVESIEKGDAQKAGIRKGDIILKVQGKMIKTAHEFRTITEELGKGSSVAVLIQRDGHPLFLAMKITE